MAKRVGVDKWMFGSTLLLVVMGVLMVFSASAVMASEKFGSPYHFLFRQLGWAVAGLVALAVSYVMPGWWFIVIGAIVGSIVGAFVDE